MKVSVAWLQKYFSDPLPETDALVDALTFHSSEVEEVIGSGAEAVLDVKVLPDRAAYALSHRGIAYELAAAVGLPLTEDPLRTGLPVYGPSDRIRISIEEEERCSRYMAALVEGVQVGPSPEWLQAALGSVGQRSINNVVDATNYVMLNIGQPLHAFDAGKLAQDADGAYAMAVRGAKAGEKITTLTGDEYELAEGTLLVTDATSGAALGIAGIKGGKKAQVDEHTTSILIEAANFEGTGIRRASQALKLWTDAGLRFQNRISPELAAYGMRDVLALILEIAGGTLVAAVDSYPSPEVAQASVHATREQLNDLLGTAFSMEEIRGALTRLAFEHVIEGEQVTVRPSFERRDSIVWQDLAEEVGRVLGYDRIDPQPLPAMQEAPEQSVWRGAEAIKDVLIERGFTEISTQSFAAEGEIRLANPLQMDRPWLRASLAANMQDALARAAQVAPRVLGPDPSLKLFELGTVFKESGEHLSLCLGYHALSGKASATLIAETVDAIIEAFPSYGLTRPDGTSGETVELSLKDANLAGIGAELRPARVTLGAYVPFSAYPSALRDIAVWTPEGTSETEVALSIQKEAGDLLARMDLFDRFEKSDEDGTRISYAFRLVFQSSERTLSDADIDPLMNAVTDTLNAQEGFIVR